MTLSVVARDPVTGHLGVAVYSGYLAVGSSVPWIEPGVGVVVTQALTNPGYGPQALEQLRNGRGAVDALGALLAEDKGREFRQVTIISATGEVATHTGARCIPEAGRAVGNDVVAQANVADSDDVWSEMIAAFSSKDGDLSDRLVASLRAAEESGGDARGARSAALLVASGDAQDPAWDRLVDLRVDDHPDPVAELERLVDLHDMYREMGAGIGAAFAGDLEEALPMLRAARHHPRGNAQAFFWEAVVLTATGDVEGGRGLLERAVEENPRWLRVWDNLPATGLTLPPSKK